MSTCSVTLCDIFGKLGVADDISHLRKEIKSKECQVELIRDQIGYDEFFRRFLLPNQPCLFDKNVVTEHWRSVNEWVLPQTSSSPNYELLDRLFGDAIVPVANCGKVQYDAQPKQDMLMSDYLKYWKDYIRMKHDSPQGCLYLKDWHFTKAFPDYHAYATPIYFSSDWLNEFWDRRKDGSEDDYRFVYMGPKNSWTPFHADVLRSYSWSANICGRKRWLLFPPGEENHLRDSLGNLAYDLTSPELDDPKKFPNRHRAREPFEVIQEAGQVIFVPSGWHHQVFNLEDTISINHNWLNGCNIDISWQFLQGELRAVQRSIEDCRGMDGWEDQCQLIMKSSSGMDYSEFFNFLHIIASQRMQLYTKSNTSEANNLKNETGSENSTNQTAAGQGQVEHPVSSGDLCASGPVLTKLSDMELGRNHFVFDLCRICQMLEDMLGNKEFLEMDHSKLFQKPEDLMHDIQRALHQK